VSPTEKIITVNIQPWMIFREVVSVPIKEEPAPAAEVIPPVSIDLSGAAEIAPPKVVAQFSETVGCSQSPGSTKSDHVGAAGEPLVNSKAGSQKMEMFD
jgi:hypothetical protein